MKKHKLIQCLTLILIAAAARADDPEPRYQMPPIEITATRAPREGFDLPLATAVIADVGRARPGLSLAESLRPVPWAVYRQPPQPVPKVIDSACAA